MSNQTKLSRSEHILQGLAKMLESNIGKRITTAALAKEVGVSEAALYRHFPSKASMFEGLIGFIEETIFSRITVIIRAESDCIKQCEQILTLILTFVERNPGMARLLTGDALSGETERLSKRINQFFERIETQLKQILREAEARFGIRTKTTAGNCANMMVAITEGKIRQFVRTEFRKKPNEYWQPQWQQLSDGMFNKLELCD